MAYNHFRHQVPKKPIAANPSVRPSYLHPPRMPILQGTSKQIAGQIGGGSFPVEAQQPNEVPSIPPNRTTLTGRSLAWRSWFPSKFIPENGGFDNISENPTRLLDVFFCFFLGTNQLHRVQKKGKPGTQHSKPTYGLVMVDLYGNLDKYQLRTLGTCQY